VLVPKGTVLTLNTNQKGGISKIMTARNNTIPGRFAIGLDDGIFTGATSRLVILLGRALPIMSHAHA